MTRTQYMIRMILMVVFFIVWLPISIILDLAKKS